MVVGGNLNSPLKLFISFAKALMEQGFPSDPFLAKDNPCFAITSRDDPARFVVNIYPGGQISVSHEHRVYAALIVFLWISNPI